MIWTNTGYKLIITGYAVIPNKAPPPPPDKLLLRSTFTASQAPPAIEGNASCSIALRTIAWSPPRIALPFLLAQPGRFLDIGPMLRVDQALVEKGLCASREKARRAVLAGQVRISDRLAAKPSDPVRPGDNVELIAPEKFVSRGGHKLEHALTHFQVVVQDRVAFDLGASTGGFTDCLLQHGAGRVFAVDVGHGQLAWKLRQDPRVVVMERTNARALTPEFFPPPFHPADLVVIDCSFISLRKILPPAVALLASSGRIIALVKPQFEAGKAEADRGAGVIRDPVIHERVLGELQNFVAELPGLSWGGVTESPLLGPAGNKEFLILLEKTS